MDLFEHQAHALFAEHGIPVGRYRVVDTADQARAAAEDIGGRVVVKAQVKTGGRGKAGGVKIAADPDEAARVAGEILGMDIKGRTVRTVVVAEACTVVDEYYLALLLDRGDRSFLALASRQGGMDIEQVAAEHPGALVRIPVDAIAGLNEQSGLKLCEDARLPQHLHEAVAGLLGQLWELFRTHDATLVEINPLAELADGSVRALDGKITIDDNARYRQTRHAAPTGSDGGDRLEARAAEKGLNYVKLDGEVGVIGNGAGLVMSTLDVVAYAGEQHGAVRPANFLDIGGGASAQVMADGLEIVLGDPAVKSVLVNVFGGITACDAVANGIVQALALLKRSGETVDKPLVVRLDGNNAAEGRRILAAASLAGVHNAETMDGAAGLAAELATDLVGKGA